MSVVDTAALRATAEAATPGPWEGEAVGSEGFFVRAQNPTGQRRRIVVARCTYEEWGPDKANAAHVAAFDPPTVLALLDDLDTLRATVARAWDDGYMAGMWDADEPNEPATINPHDPTTP